MSDPLDPFVKDARDSFVEQPRTRFVEEPAARAIAVEGELPGGTLMAFPDMVIVPDNAVPTEGQVTESAFLKMLAERMVLRFGRARGEDFDVLQNTIARWLKGARRSLFPNEMLEPWLRGQLGISTDRHLAVEEFFSLILAKLEGLPVLLSVLEEVTALPPDEVADRLSEDENFLPEGLAATIPGVALQAIDRIDWSHRPTGSIPSSPDDGNFVHLLIQQHYCKIHSSDPVLCESRVYWHGVNYLLRQWSRDVSAINPEFAAVAFALMTRRGGSKRPDICNIGLREVFEIKPRLEALEGLKQIYGVYLPWINEAIYELAVSRNEPLPLPPPRLYRPGFWIPGPFYLVPPNKLAFAFLAAPGLILYDLYKLELDPEANISMLDLLLVGLGVVVVILALASPVPGDEATILYLLPKVIDVMRPAA